MLTRLKRRGTSTRVGAEALEKRVLLASISGTVFDDPNFNGRLDAGETGERAVVYLDANDNREFDQVNLEFPAGREQVTVDNATVRSTVVASGVADAVAETDGAVLRIAVWLDLQHTRDGDLTATLVSPSGRRVVLFDRVGGDGDDFLFTYFYDDAALSLEESAPPFNGEHRPAQPLAPLLDEPLDGDWTLELTDNATGESGNLRYWAVNILVGERMAVSDAQGHYAISGLFAGTYTARTPNDHVHAQTLPALDGGYTVTLGAAGAATGVDFGLHAVGSNVVTGVVYDDADSDGVFDAGESPLPGRTVYWDGNGSGVYDPEPVTFAATDVPMPLGDEETYSYITVDGLPDGPMFVTVALDMTHATPQTIDLALISPSGGRFPLGYHESSYENRTFSRMYLGEFPMNGTWTLEVEDEDGPFRGTIRSWGLTFEGFWDDYAVTTDAQGQYRFEHMGDFGVVPLAGETQTHPVGPTHHLEQVYEDQSFVRNFGVTTRQVPAAVVGRHVFYDGSTFDHGTGGDDAAIATDKTALLPGNVATFANYSSYARGLNGVVVDIARLPGGAALTAADFSFKTGNDGDVAGWGALASAPAVSVRPGAGAGGSDRVTLTWADGAVRNGWLEVTVLANDRTGLAAPDVFYFGNLVGETGNAAATTVTAADLVATRAASGGAAVGVASAHDFNRDGRVNLQDQAQVRSNFRSSLHLLSAPSTQAAGAGRTAPRPLFGDVPVPATGPRSAYRPARAWDDAEVGLLA